ncbi:hypothetical protein MP228_001066 [Amoeboaphelidium protococcarum]|nr:hypothetical protein MP228_001066 [Amoeboaphelidium protococcarum]
MVTMSSERMDVSFLIHDSDGENDDHHHYEGGDEYDAAESKHDHSAAAAAAQQQCPNDVLLNSDSSRMLPLASNSHLYKMHLLGEGKPHQCDSPNCLFKYAQPKTWQTDFDSKTTKPIPQAVIRNVADHNRRYSPIKPGYVFQHSQQFQQQQQQQQQYMLQQQQQQRQVIGPLHHYQQQHNVNFQYPRPLTISYVSEDSQGVTAQSPPSFTPRTSLSAVSVADHHSGNPLTPIDNALDEEAIRRLFMAAESSKNAAKAKRDSAMLALLLDLKLACQRIADLKYKDVKGMVDGSFCGLYRYGKAMSEPTRHIKCLHLTKVKILEWIDFCRNQFNWSFDDEAPVFVPLPIFGDQHVPRRMPLKRDAISKVFSSIKSVSGVSMSKDMVNRTTLTDQLAQKQNIT